MVRDPTVFQDRTTALMISMVTNTNLVSNSHRKLLTQCQTSRNLHSQEK